jgi:hypothetical protein
MVTLGVVVVVQALLGVGHHVPRTGSCDVCGVESAMLFEQIQRLQHCPKWRDRDNAAHALRRFDWRCHPEVVGALAYSLLHDCEEEVREEAAESLTKMAPCLAVAHEALSLAAARDPDHCTRHEARKGLRNLKRHCAGPCNVCDHGTVEVVSPLPGGPVIGLPGPGPVLGPGEILVPSPDSRVDPLPPGSTPGVPGIEALPPPAASRREKAPEPQPRSRFARFLFGVPERISNR